MRQSSLPSGEAWLHEIKHDGFRVIARKDGDRVRLYSRPATTTLSQRKRLIGTAPNSRPPVRHQYDRGCEHQTQQTE
jgi:hypothetical protein